MENEKKCKGDGEHSYIFMDKVFLSKPEGSVKYIFVCTKCLEFEIKLIKALEGGETI